MRKLKSNKLSNVNHPSVRQKPDLHTLNPNYIYLILLRYTYIISTWDLSAESVSFLANFAKWFLIRPSAYRKSLLKYLSTCFPGYWSINSTALIKEVPLSENLSCFPSLLYLGPPSQTLSQCQQRPDIPSGQLHCSGCSMFILRVTIWSVRERSWQNLACSPLENVSSCRRHVAWFSDGPKTLALTLFELERATSDTLRIRLESRPA